MTSERLPGDFISETDGLPRTAQVESLARSSRRRSPSSPLSITDVPDITAEWGEIARFALSFDGYAYASREWLMFLADGLQAAWYERPVLKWAPGCIITPPTLDELRGALFFEQRSYRWQETEPQGEDLRYMRALIAAIANQVREGGTP